MKPNNLFEDVQRNLHELIANSPAADIEKNVKAFLAQGFSRLDLVTREEFDVQVALVERLLQRVAALEAALEAKETQASKETEEAKETQAAKASEE